jgi:hypothetical protein
MSFSACLASLAEQVRMSYQDQDTEYGIKPADLHAFPMDSGS